jgi:hypothetical protein
MTRWRMCQGQHRSTRLRQLRVKYILVFSSSWSRKLTFRKYWPSIFCLTSSSRHAFACNSNTAVLLIIMPCTLEWIIISTFLRNLMLQFIGERDCSILCTDYEVKWQVYLSILNYTVSCDHNGLLAALRTSEPFQWRIVFRPRSHFVIFCFVL